MKGISESIFELIDKDYFRKMSGMYLGKKRIDILRALLDGYQNAIRYYKIEDEKALRFEGFREWLIQHYSEGEYNANWDCLILQQCKDDQHKSVDTFFELYDLFKSSENG